MASLALKGWVQLSYCVPRFSLVLENVYLIGLDTLIRLLLFDVTKVEGTICEVI